jgi:thioredoxin-related protein
MKRLLVSMSALLVMSAFASASQWLTDYRQALQTAKAEGKPVLMDFTGSDWCMWCIRLHHEVFSTPEFSRYADQNLVLLKVDFPQRKPLPSAQTAQNEELAARFGVQSFPTVLLLKPDGSKAGKLGYQAGGPRPFIASIEHITKR